MRRLALTLFLFVSLSPIFATEGMWIPLLLSQLNESEMQDLGMKMKAEDIYSVNKGSLKDAIVHFGGFCTGEIISDQGLVLTNHHCGYRQIQSHSSLENNYLKDGFWAMKQSKEIPNPGLFVRFIIRIEDISEQALEGITTDMTEAQRQSAIDKNLNTIKQNTSREEYQDVMTRAFYKGNQYYLFVTETYRDVRLVGAPPSSIGKFGADTDNWVWPRHTGDFSLFRIYAGKDNKPAEYSPDNVPFKPRHFLPVSTSGISEGDFTMVFGFPGRTDEYLPAIAMEQTVDVLNPIKIGIRDQALEIMNAAMQADEKTRIQYASKQSRISNSWKKWIGQRQGIKATGGIEKRKELEAEFRKMVNADSELSAKYGNILSTLEDLYKQRIPYEISKSYIDEIGSRNIELFRFANQLHSYVKTYKSNGEEALQKRMDRLKNTLSNFYKDYNPAIDKAIFAQLMETYLNGVKREHLSDYAIEQISEQGKDYKQWAEVVFAKSILSNETQAMALFEKDPVEFMERVEKDYAYQLARSIVDSNREKITPSLRKINEQLNPLQRNYMQALMEVFPDRRFYPDANGTLRVSYGQVSGFSPRDGIQYIPSTYLEGVIEKYVPGDYEFDVPKKLLKLYEQKDYGPYAAENGKMPVCFIGSNHTSGGNSGSPAIDAEGNLIGLNFDRVWEGTMSDLHYDASICRNIMVDVRYILFIIDKYAGAGHLVDEMKVIK